MTDKIKKPSTLKAYANSLKRLDDMKINYDNPKSIKFLISQISKLPAGKKKSDVDNNKTVSSSTIRTYLISVKQYYEQNGYDKSFIKELGEAVSKINKKATEQYDKNELNEKEKGVFLDWNTVKDVLDKLKLAKDESQTQFKRYITIALYVLVPPRRLTDYSRMIVLKNKTNDVTKNYYVMQPKPTFYYNVYKTSNKYGSQSFAVPKKLSDILDEYIEKYNLIGKELLDVGENDLSKKIKRIFTKYTKKAASVNTLRHSYISHMWESGKIDTSAKQKLLSVKMAHSQIIQQNVYKKIIKKYDT
jgi:integrase